MCESSTAAAQAAAKLRQETLYDISDVVPTAALAIVSEGSEYRFTIVLPDGRRTTVNDGFWLEGVLTGRFPLIRR